MEGRRKAGVKGWVVKTGCGEPMSLEESILGMSLEVTFISICTHLFFCTNRGWLGEDLEVFTWTTEFYEPSISTVTEPFICPSLYEKYINSSSVAVVDEWTLSQAMGSNLASEMENHYATFIVSPRFISNEGTLMDLTDLIPYGYWDRRSKILQISQEQD